MSKWITIIPTIFFSFIFLYGLLNAIIPKIMWKTFESWKATKEPTTAYFITRRISGIIAMLIVVGIFLFPYFMSKQ